MVSSDLTDSHPAFEVTPKRADAYAVESTESNTGSHDPGDPVAEKRVALPKPDTNNITVLTESLPNDPILPWHHFDSPWLEKEESAATAPREDAAPSADDDSSEQLSLALDGVTSAEMRPNSELSTGHSLKAHSTETPPKILETGA
ncbi:hypothetical protein GFS31_23190 [Leptolyngbya sp. BL0902]|uniref:hypothetical protein n=1 Tax=Leptolyngbya sp. BL0902 TaxID=1115757 RepID=UPI0018E7CD66|nr:hypothetical protein [Leptolyngbya sp. BL0902]QQE65631.1 hypothetical protein GFS31_23190 [Leptolyngbya sp. BL0902]